MKLRKLIAVQLRNMFGAGNKKISGAAAVLISFGAMMYLSFFYSYMLYSSLPEHLYDSILRVMVCGGYLLILIIGVNMAQGTLFGYKDFDLLRSLPVTDRDIVASKLATYILTVYLYAGFYVIPAMIMYGIYAHPGVMFAVYAVVGYLTMPASAVVLSSLIGLFIRTVSAGKKHSELIRNILSVVMVLVIVFMSAYAGSADTASEEVLGTVSGYSRCLVLVSSYVDACVSGRLSSLLIAVGVNILILSLFLRFISPQIIAAGERGEITWHDRNFRMGRLRGSSPLKALYRKELQVYLRNFNYLMNTAVGLIIILVFVIMALVESVKSGTLFGVPLQTVHMFAEETGYIGLLFAGMAVHMSCMTGVSISLEGKHLWLTKTLPVREETIFMSKIAVNLTIALIPMIPAALIFGIIMKLPWSYYILALMYLGMAALFTAMFGLIINLCFPKLEFDREIQVIKQSMSSFVTLMSSMVIGIGILVLFIFLFMHGFAPWQVMTAIMLGYVVMDTVLAFILLGWGIKRFRALA